MSNFNKAVKEQYDAENSSSSEVDALFNDLGATGVDTQKDPGSIAEQGDAFYASEKQKATEVENLFSGFEAPPPAQAAEGETAEPSFFEKQKADLVNASTAAGKGLLKGAEDLGNGAHDLANLAEDYFASRGLGDGKWIDEANLDFGIQEPTSFEDKVVYSVARYLGPMGALGKGLKMASLTGKALTAGTLAGSGLMTALTTDPEQKGLSDLVAAEPALSWMIPDILTSKDDDTKVERRLKRGAEDMYLGLGAMALVKGIGMVAKKTKDYFGAKEAAKKLTEVAAEVKSGAGGVPPGGVGENVIKKVAAQAEIPPEKLSGVRKVEESLNQPQFVRPEGSVGPNPLAEMDVAEAFDFENQPHLREAWVRFKDGTVDLATAQKNANAMIDTPEKARAFLDSIKPGDALNGDQVAALTTMMNGVRMDTFLNGIKDVAKMADHELVQFANMRAQLEEIAVKLTGGTSNSARGMRFAQEAFANASDAKKVSMVSEYVRLAGPELKEQVKYARAALNTGMTIPELAKAVATKQSRFKLSDKFYSLWVNGALAKANTFFTNALGSLSTNILHPIETGVAAMIPGSQVKFSEVHAIYQGQAQALLESIGAFKDVFKNLEMPAGYASNFDIKGPTFQTEMGGAMGKILNAIGFGIELPTRATAATDAFFKVMAGRMRQSQYAMRLANEAGGDMDMYRNIMKNIPDDLELASKQFADRRTFAAPLDELTFGKAGQGAVNFAETMPFGLGRIFVPFTKTITNLADTTLRYSPLGYLAPKIRADLFAGGYRAAEAQAKVAIGTGVLLTGGILGASGIVRGSGGYDYSAKRALQGDGTPRDNAIKIGDTWVPLESLQPIANVFLMGADIAEIGKYMHDEEDDIQYQAAVMEFVHIVADRLTPDYLAGSAKDFLTGISDLSEGKRSQHEWATGAANILETATPYRWVYVNKNALGGDVVKKDTSEDADMAFVQSAYSQWKNKLFNGLGFGDHLPDLVNIFNEPIQVPAGFTGSMVSAFYTDKEPDEVLMGLRKLGLDRPNIGTLDETEATFHVRMPPRVVEKGADGKSVPYRMSPKEYAQFMKYMNEPIRGRTMKETVGQILKTEFFTDERKKLEIKKAIGEYRGEAKRKMMREYPEIEERYNRVKKERRKLLRPTFGVGQ